MSCQTYWLSWGIWPPARVGTRRRRAGAALPGFSGSKNLDSCARSRIWQYLSCRRRRAAAARTAGSSSHCSHTGGRTTMRGGHSRWRSRPVGGGRPKVWHGIVHWRSPRCVRVPHGDWQHTLPGCSYTWVLEYPVLVDLCGGRDNFHVMTIFMKILAIMKNKKRDSRVFQFCRKILQSKNFCNCANL